MRKLLLSLVAVALVGGACGGAASTGGYDSPTRSTTPRPDVAAASRGLAL